MTTRPTVGLIVPSSNPTIESVLPLVAEVLDVTFLTTRLRVRRIAADAGSDAQFDRAALLSAAELLGDAEVEVVSWAGTAGFWLGAERESAVLAEVSQAAGFPLTSSRVALLAAADERRDLPVGVLTPYTPVVHEGVCATFRSEGFDVVADEALGIERNLDFARIPADVLTARMRVLGERGAGVIPVVCTNVFGALPAVADAPFLVADSVLATLWHAARLAGATTLDYFSFHDLVLDRQVSLSRRTA